MVGHFRQNFTNTFIWRARDIGMSQRQVVILASLIEKETANRDERFLVSSVFHNRLRKSMLLDCDSTIIYALKKAGAYDGDLRWADLKSDSPYNTRKHRGLPPGPIASPGYAALEAALYPENTEYLYFVAKDGGSHYFSRTPGRAQPGGAQVHHPATGRAALIELEPRSFAGHGLALHDGARLVFGFTDAGFPAAGPEAAVPLPAAPLPEAGPLPDASSATRSGMPAWRPTALLLERPGIVAVVQTADCLPLFFFNDERSRGGILHVGWRGLQQGIEEKLGERLGGGLGRLSLLPGAGHRKKMLRGRRGAARIICEEVLCQRIIQHHVAAASTLMDLKGGLKLSLAALGVAPGRIQDSGLCTFCSGGRFPSYRRDGKTGRRIFNFLLLK